MPYNPSNEGLLNLQRAQRWCWNFNTFLINQNPTEWSVPPNPAPVCLTFKQSDLQYLLDDRVDTSSNPPQSIPSAGIRFYIGLSQDTQGKNFLQAFALRAEAEELFEGNQEIVYNDVHQTPGYNAQLIGYDVAQSGQAIPGSVLNPPEFPGNVTSVEQSLLSSSQNYPTAVPSTNQADPNAVLQAITNYHAAITGTGVISLMPPTAQTVIDTFVSPAVSHPFQITPVLWPWAFFFGKSYLIEEFGDTNTGQLQSDIRLYFGVTDQYDSNETGATPGILKTFLVGVESDVNSSNYNADDIDPQAAGNHILDFSMPCPQYCGQAIHRFWTPST